MENRELQGKVVVITGASSGFGKGAALEFSRRGAYVVLAARRGQLLNELVNQCQSLGGRALGVPTDVSEPGDVQRLAEAALSNNQIDVWVNNAGSGALGRFEEIPLEEHIQVIETDLLGTLYGSYFALRQFRQQGEGTLVNVASVIGKVPAPYFASYAAAKHGVVGLSAALRQELKENNIETIHVCTVMPTSMDTPFFEHAANYLGHETVPIPPVYDAQKVVDVIVRLATNPEDEISVGTAGKFMTFAHQIAPALTEAMMARQTHKAVVKDAPPTDDTPGAVQRTSAKGTTVGDAVWAACQEIRMLKTKRLKWSRNKGCWRRAS
jgi:short-subunit dehydrogenase